MSRPNIIFVMTDDQTHEQMSCAGHPILQTPNMDRLATEGVRFANAFCTNSLCAPSRATVLTGCYSHIHGIRGNSEKRDEYMNKMSMIAAGAVMAVEKHAADGTLQQKLREAGKRVQAKRQQKALLNEEA